MNMSFLVECWASGKGRISDDSGFCLEKLRRKLGVGIGRLWGALMALLATHLFVSHETEQINTVPIYSSGESSGPKVIW